MTTPGRRGPASTDPKDERPNMPRPSPNDVQPDFPKKRAPADPDELSKRKADAIAASDADPEAQDTANAVQNLSTND
jgi:hypothetical protein